MINALDLKSRTAKDLANLARKKKILGWHAMRKEELVQALTKLARQEARKAVTASRKTPLIANGTTRSPPARCPSTPQAKQPSRRSSRCRPRRLQKTAE